MSSQNAAFRLFFPPNEHLPHPSIVSVRGPDYGYSPKGDGTDYPASWNGQTPFDTYYLDSVLPASPAAYDLFQNFLAVSDEENSFGLERHRIERREPRLSETGCQDHQAGGVEA